MARMMRDEKTEEELKWFDCLSGRIVEVLRKDNYSQQQAEELGFFIAQTIRDVPRLLALLEKSENHSVDEVMDSIHDFLSNQFAFQQAHKLLMRNAS
jgi:hypothetical protein